MNKVELLYDNLFSLNARKRKDVAYPIHKSLRYSDNRINNLYDYLLMHYDLPSKGEVLDCGCGVGYGSLLLAGRFRNLTVHGISLSSKEIDKARFHCKNIDLTANCTFQVKSYDDLPHDTYDCIIAIESLKHSPDIKHTMLGLVNSLKKSGRLIIIEDVFKFPLNNFASRRQCEDWELQRTFTAQDYCDIAGLSILHCKNMTDYVKLPSKLLIFLRIAFSEMLVFISRIGLKDKSRSKIMRGGFYQELLYRMGKLDYLIISAKKEI